MNIIMAFLLSISYAQEYDYQEIKYEQIANGRRGLDKGFMKVYTPQTGPSVAVGDTLIINVPGGSSSRTNAVGGSYSSGGAGVLAGTSSSVSTSYFEYVFNGTYKATVGKMLLAGMTGDADPTIYQATRKIAGTEVVVQRIKLGGTKRLPYVWMECAFVSNRERGNISGIVTISDFDKAVRMGEVFDPRNISRDVALAQIKEAKDLMDLGIYTKEQFDAVVEKYKPYLQ